MSLHKDFSERQLKKDAKALSKLKFDDLPTEAEWISIQANIEETEDNKWAWFFSKQVLSNKRHRKLSPDGPAHRCFEFLCDS